MAARCCCRRPVFRVPVPRVLDISRSEPLSPELRELSELKCTPEEELCNEMMSKDIMCKQGEILDGCFILGGTENAALLPEDLSMISMCIGSAFQTATHKIFGRLLLKGNLIYSSMYKRMSKHNNSTVRYYEKSSDSHEFAQVKYFLQYTDAVTEEVHNLAIITPFRMQHKDPNAHIVPVELDSMSQTAIPIGAIETLCMYIEYKGSDRNTCRFICQFPNRVETD